MINGNMYKILGYFLNIALLLLTAACSTSKEGGELRDFFNEDLLAGKKLRVVLLPLENRTTFPKAGTIVKDLLQSELYERSSVKLHESNKPLSSNPKEMEHLFWEEEVDALLFGSVTEYGYQHGLHEEPTVGINLRLVDWSGEILWTSSATGIGQGFWRRDSLNNTGQRLLKKMVKKLDKVVKKANRKKIKKSDKESGKADDGEKKQDKSKKWEKRKYPKLTSVKASYLQEGDRLLLTLNGKRFKDESVVKVRARSQGWQRRLQTTFIGKSQLQFSLDNLPAQDELLIQVIPKKRGRSNVFHYSLNAAQIKQGVATTQRTPVLPPPQMRDNAVPAKMVESAPFKKVSLPTQTAPVLFQLLTIDPPRVTASTSLKKLLLNGQGFKPGAHIVIDWDGGGARLGNNRVRFINDRQLEVSVRTGRVADIWGIKVENPDRSVTNSVELVLSLKGSGERLLTTSTLSSSSTSAAKPSNIEDSGSLPVIDSIIPIRVAAKSDSAKISLKGQNFSRDMQLEIRWDGGGTTFGADRLRLIDGQNLEFSVRTGTSTDNWSLYLFKPGVGSSESVELEIY